MSEITVSEKNFYRKYVELLLERSIYRCLSD